MSSALSHALSVDRRHPSLPGHFPGAPVVPGVVFLSYILTELQRQAPTLEVCGVRKLKFLRMLLPGQRFVVDFATPDCGTLRFKCWRIDATDGADEQRELLVDGHLDATDGADEQRELLVDGHLLLRGHEEAA